MPNTWLGETEIHEVIEILVRKICREIIVDGVIDHYWTGLWEEGSRGTVLNGRSTRSVVIGIRFGGIWVEEGRKVGLDRREVGLGAGREAVVRIGRLRVIRSIVISAERAEECCVKIYDWRLTLSGHDRRRWLKNKGGRRGSRTFTFLSQSVRIFRRKQTQKTYHRRRLSPPLLFALFLPKCTFGNRYLESRDDLWDVRLVKLFDRLVQLCALQSFHEQLGNLGAPLRILRFNLPYLPPTLRSSLSTFFTGPKSISGESPPVLIERRTRLVVPYLPLALWKSLPCHPDDLRQGRVVRFDVGRDMLRFNKRRAK